MNFLMSRRLRYFAGGTGILFLLLAALRAVFLLGFSGVSPGENPEAVWPTLGIGLQFDMRLALLLMLPVGITLLLPRLRQRFAQQTRWAIRAYLALLLFVLVLIYVFDFGHYAYLGVRLNASAFRYTADAQISTDMIWQTYPVVWITLGWLATVALTLLAFLRLERATLDKPQAQISPQGSRLRRCSGHRAGADRAAGPLYQHQSGEPGAAALERCVLLGRQPDRLAGAEPAAVPVRHLECAGLRV
jgi:hypothetical protein